MRFGRCGDGSYDLAIVGAGIVGLAHALAATRMGKRVIVIDRDAQANGASIQNFGLVTVTGQQQGECWNRAIRSRDVWLDVAQQAGIDIEHRGLLIVAQRPEARRVLEAFLETDMGSECSLFSPAQASEQSPLLRHNGIAAAMWSPHELRIESRLAVHKLAKWLEDACGVTFLRSTLVMEIDLPRIETTQGTIQAGHAVVCPGHDFQTLFAERISAHALTTCKLHMLRIQPSNVKVQLGAAIMSDLSIARGLGFAGAPDAAGLRSRLALEQPDELANGIHLVVVQASDGSLVVGDSHHYGETIEPFASARIDRLILEELDTVLNVGKPTISEHWIGTYASSDDKLSLIDRPSDGVRIVIVTSGTGVSTAFAIGEEVVMELFGETRADR